jgi:hypothetical protein
MRQIIDLTVVGVALSVGILLTGGVQAEVFSSAPADQVDAVDGSGCGEPLSGGELHTLTGGYDIQIEKILEQITNANLNGQMTGNVLNSSATGYNMLAAGALNNVSGIATVIQNSGNQVIINSATILNLYVD